MEFANLLTAKNRDELREWLADNHDKEKEGWIIVKRGRTKTGFEEKRKFMV